MDKIIETILGKANVSIEDIHFFPRIFSRIAKWKKKQQSENDCPIERLVTEEYDTLTRRLMIAKLQNSSSVRNLHFSRELAKLLINEKGQLQHSKLDRSIKLLTNNLYSIGPGREADGVYQEHLIHILKQIQSNQTIQSAISSISRPYQNLYGDEIIRHTLQLPKNKRITDGDAARAALSALMTYMRQNVGSCFATAPAIMIQQEQPLQLLKDLRQLLDTGQLKRTFGGVEYAVPMSFSWGTGDLRKELTLSNPPNEKHTKFWVSPGFLESLEAVEIIDQKKPLREKIHLLKELFATAIKTRTKQGETLTLSVEDWLEAILLDHFSLDKKDIEQRPSLPTPLQMGGIPPAAPTTTKSVKQLYTSLKIAKDTFLTLTDNALLKTWEYSLASFAESKAQFTTWNLYTSLGLKPEDSGGIGPRLYAILDDRLQKANQTVHEIQEQYENAHQQLQYLRRRMERANSEREVEWSRMDYKSKIREIDALEAERDHYHTKAKTYANAYRALNEAYYTLFPSYFQEVYDADLHEIAIGPYDDSPAGFRLLFKHGRASTSQWTQIHSPADFIESLASFFTGTEYTLHDVPDLQGIKEDITFIVSDIILHIRSHEFIESAFDRIAIHHKKRPVKNPLQNLEKIEAKPWVYTSGGSMSTLVGSYYCLEEKPKEISRWVESPTELLVFLLDLLKELPERDKEIIRKIEEKSLLCHSPTHAFLLKPNFPIFRKGWESDLFTYTWVRDEVVRAQQSFYDNLFIDSDEIAYLIKQLSQALPIQLKHLFIEAHTSFTGRMHVYDLSAHLERSLPQKSSFILDTLDQVLYQHLPLFPRDQLEERVERILQGLPGINQQDIEKMMQLFNECSKNISLDPIFGAEHLQNSVKALLALHLGVTKTAIDYHKEIQKQAQKLGFATPEPLLFADTNWITYFFAFVVGPSSGELELWRVDPIGREGAPMNIWKPWLDGSQKQPDWGVFNHISEYTA